jgi:hypothetical protein
MIHGILDHRAKRIKDEPMARMMENYWQNNSHTSRVFFLDTRIQKLMCVVQLIY